MRKVALVTGGTGSIGLEIVRQLVLKDCFVVFTYNENESLAKSLENKFCFPYRLDLKNEDNIKVFVDFIKRKFGRLDFLVNNAGIISDSLLEKMSSESIRNIIEINLIGPMILTRECLDLLKTSKGRIINISSVVGILGNFGQTNYSAAKAGLIGFTKSLSKELASHEISVNSVAPGFIDSKMVDGMKQEIKEKLLKIIPMKKFGNPEDVAEFVVFLLTSSGNYFTGQTFCIDGGLS